MIELIFNNLTYSSLAFLLFLLFFLCLFFVLPGKWTKIIVILAGNIFFYVYADGIPALVIVFFSTLFLYVVSICMGKIYSSAVVNKDDSLSPKQEIEFWKPYKKKCRMILWIGICVLLFILTYVKIGKIFCWEIVNDVRQIRVRKMLIPMGLSYYTFSSIGYLIDIYKRKVTCEHNPVCLLAVITFFPAIVEGPIIKIDKLSEQFRNVPRFSYERFCFGMQRILWGFFKKLVVADRIMPVTSLVFANVFDFAGVELIIAIILHVFAFYADFSGCMDIVLGVSEAMGITMEENFRQPFFATNVAEFWRRWHITLFAWFREYIYMPIAKSKWFKKVNRLFKSKLGSELGQVISLAIPTIIVWLLTGLWHGTGKDYIAWALYWVIIVIVGELTKSFFERTNQLLKFRTETFGWRLFRIIRTNILYICGGIIILSGSTYGLHGSIYIIKQIFLESRIWELFNGGIYRHGMDQNNFLVALVGIIMIMFIDSKKDKGIKIRKFISEQPLIFRWFVWISMIVMVVVWGQYGPGYNAAEFVYRGF